MGQAMALGPRRPQDSDMNRRRFLAALAAGAVTPHVLSAAARPSRLVSDDDLYALVLGTTQDGGLPQVGCYTPRCDRGRALQAAGAGRYVSSLALVEPAAERYYLVDATPDITRQLDLIDEPDFRRRATDRRPFDGIFLTHAHIGHYTGLALLGHEGLGVRDTPVYCTRAMADFLAANQPWRFLVDQERIELRPLETERWHRVDEHLEVQLWQVPHRDEFADTVGFVFRGPERTLLFLPDIDNWSRWRRGATRSVREVDIALLDGAFWSLDELPGRAIEDVPHPPITHSMDVFQQVVDARATRVVFTHLNNSNPALDDGGPEQAEILRRGFEVAREGLRIAM